MFVYKTANLLALRQLRSPAAQIADYQAVTKVRGLRPSLPPYNPLSAKGYEGMAGAGFGEAVWDSEIFFTKKIGLRKSVASKM